MIRYKLAAHISVLTLTVLVLTMLRHSHWYVLLQVSNMRSERLSREQTADPAVDPPSVASPNTTQAAPTTTPQAAPTTTPQAEPTTTPTKLERDDIMHRAAEHAQAAAKEQVVEDQVSTSPVQTKPSSKPSSPDPDLTAQIKHVGLQASKAEHAAFDAVQNTKRLQEKENQSVEVDAAETHSEPAPVSSPAAASKPTISDSPGTRERSFESRKRAMAARLEQNAKEWNKVPTKSSTKSNEPTKRASSPSPFPSKDPRVTAVIRREGEWWDWWWDWW